LFVLPIGRQGADFGIAQLRGDERQLKTKTGTTRTVAYMPSEQLKGSTSTRADVYGVGATMFACWQARRRTARGATWSYDEGAHGAGAADRVRDERRCARVARIVDPFRSRSTATRVTRPRAPQADVRVGAS
jgi:hypothetical protein